MDFDSALPVRELPSPRTEPTRIDTLLDELVPRDGHVPKHLATHVSLLLTRLGNLKRKLLGVSHRTEEWRARCDETRTRLEQRIPAQPSPFPPGSNVPGAKMSSSVTYQDARLENEFECVLFTVRSSLDILARVVACYLSGATGLNSFSKLAKYQFPPTLEKVERAVRAAWIGWIEDLRERRDSAGHYRALSVESKVERTRTAGGDDVVEVSTLIRIPIDPSKNEGNPWLDPVPVWGDTSITTSEISDPDELVKYRAELRDMKGRLILETRDPPRARGPHRDADIFVNEVTAGLVDLVEQVLAALPNAEGGGAQDEDWEDPPPLLNDDTHTC